jgi:diguanylate cyclase (GGDEF)-like protein
MALSESEAGPGILLVRIRYAYWLASLIVAAMIAVTFFALNAMTGEQRRIATVAALASQQRDLIGEIAGSPGTAGQAAAPAGLMAEFSARQAAIAGEIAGLGTAFRPDPRVAGRAFEAGAALAAADPGSAIPASLSDPAFSAYAALAAQAADAAVARAERTHVVNRNLFLASIFSVALVIVAIFRPLSRLIERHAEDLLEARNSMAYVAAHDGLTGLHNRAFLLDHFKSQINGAIRRGERLAVLQIDLDGFKQINDTLGHAVGDHVLVVTAERMRQSCRASDLCVRLGGDEFVVLLGAAGNSEDINMVAARILGRINQPIEHQGVTIQAGASAGIAVFPVDADSPEDLLVHADLALYDAKKRGRGGLAFFSAELRRELEHRKQLEAELQQAIRTEAFDVHFQPQIRLKDGRIAGVEALMRWDHPQRGMVAPASFIPVAEKSGLMADIGRIVIGKAVASAAAWHREGLEFGRLAVNVSGSELRQPDFDAFLFALFETTGLPPTKLSLEIVESVILDDDKLGIVPRLRRIRAAGVHVELDDFGTGYASLSHVNPNEIDRLKIDRRFVQNIDDNGDNTKIVKAITELARGLGISIIAEGAETQEELMQLVEIGCEEVQGYSIAYPMPAAEARDWIRLRSKDEAVVNLNLKRRA